MIRIELLKLQEKVIRCLARTFEYGMVCCAMLELGNALNADALQCTFGTNRRI